MNKVTFSSQLIAHRYKFGRLIICALFLSIFFISACGEETNPSNDNSAGNSDQNTDNTISTLYGRFIDREVEGLSYITSSGLKGTTDEAGTFKYKTGDDVTFSIGALELGKTKAAITVTPKDIDGGAEAEGDRYASNVALKIVSFLLTLDEDGNPDNGIKIPNEIIQAITEVVNENKHTRDEIFTNEASTEKIDALIEDTTEKIKDSGIKTGLKSRLDAEKQKVDRLREANDHLQETLNNLVTKLEVSTNNTILAEGSSLDLEYGKAYMGTKNILELTLKCFNDSGSELSCFSYTSSKGVEIDRKTSVIDPDGFFYVYGNKENNKLTLITLKSGNTAIFIQTGGASFYFKANIKEITSDIQSGGGYTHFKGESFPIVAATSENTYISSSKVQILLQTDKNERMAKGSFYIYLNEMKFPDKASFLDLLSSSSEMLLAPNDLSEYGLFFATHDEFPRTVKFSGAIKLTWIGNNQFFLDQNGATLSVDDQPLSFDKTTVIWTDTIDGSPQSIGDYGVYNYNGHFIDSRFINFYKPTGSWKENLVTSPKVGEFWHAGDTQTIEWNSSLLTGSKVSLFVLYDSPYGDSSYDNMPDLFNTSEHADAVGFKLWHKFDVSVPNTGSYKVNNPEETLLFKKVNEESVILIVSEEDGSFGYSSDVFTLSLYKDLNVTGDFIKDLMLYPMGGETWYKDDTKKVRWESSFIDSETVSIYALHDYNGVSDSIDNDSFGLTTDPSYTVNSKKWYRLASSQPNNGKFYVKTNLLENPSAGPDNTLILVVGDQDGSFGYNRGMFSLYDAEYKNTEEDFYTDDGHYIERVIPDGNWIDNLIISPDGGEAWFAGDSETVKWNNSKITGDTVSLYATSESASYFPAYSSVFGFGVHYGLYNSAPLYTHAVSSQPWYKFAEFVPNSGEYLLENVEEILFTYDNESSILIVSDEDGSFGYSSDVFSISKYSNLDLTADRIENLLISPNGGEHWFEDEIVNVEWNNSLLSGSTVSIYSLHDYEYDSELGWNYDLFYSNDPLTTVNSKDWYKIASSVPNNGKFTMPAKDMEIEGKGMAILIVDDQNGTFGYNNKSFTYHSYNKFFLDGEKIDNLLISPRGGESWNSGETQLIQWNNSLINSSKVSIYFSYYPYEVVGENDNLFTSSDPAGAVSTKHWLELITSIPNSGSYSIEFSEYVYGDDMVILIVGDENEDFGFSNDIFTITKIDEY